MRNLRLLAAGAIALVFAAIPFAALTSPVEAKTVAVPHLSATMDGAPSLALPVMAPAPAPAPSVVLVEAAKDTTVTAPTNAWISDAVGIITALLLAALTRFLAFLPAPVAWLVRTYGVKLIVEEAVRLGYNAVPGAYRNAPLTIDVGNRVLAVALQWAVDTVPGFLLKIAGGEEGLKAKIFAALHLEADASAEAFGLKAVA